jgi:hypothetical protein
MNQKPHARNLAALAIFSLATISAHAATMSASPDAPVVDGLDVANYGTVNATEKWWPGNNTGAASAKGQTFTTGSVPLLLRSITYQSGPKSEPTKQYILRVGTVSGSTFTQSYSETATQAFTWNTNEYMTWTFDSPVELNPNTLYGIDIGFTSSTTAWTTGIPYLNVTANSFAGGQRYTSGSNGIGTSSLSLVSNGDRIFHLDMQHPMTPSPDIGALVPAGDLTLSWTNRTPTTGTDVWVDVWFGTDPGNLTKIVNAGLNTTSHMVNAPGANTYYWRIDSYLAGAATGTPVQSTVFHFIVSDSDGDGLPDAYELLHTGPPSTTALNRLDDRDNDGINNWDEFQNGTNPSLADTDGDGLLDGDNIILTSADPRYTAWATVGILFTDAGAQRTFRGEGELGTDPLKADTDGDGLPDGVETSTGIWGSASDTGTNPLNADTDGDGLPDGVETNTGIFVSATNTGTNPLLADTDGDGAGDWYEITASFTDPFNAASKPNIPYPLPHPDTSTGATDKPVKVYIMSGQSNMLGYGTTSGSEDNTLETMTIRQNKFPNLINEAGAWTTRQDVRYRGVISDTAKVKLSPGTLGVRFGPELGFGYIMGWLHDEPVLLVKSCIGNRSLGWDILPPGSPSYQYGGFQYAGFGQSPSRWAIGTTPTPISWYSGKESDRFFRDESEWAIPDSPATNVVDVLDNFATEYPDWAAQGFEISGFVWWQGDKDRGYYSNRYPGKVVNNAPFVLATLGQTQMNSTNAADKAILDAQLAVDGESGKYPQFAGNVKTVYAHPLSEGGASNSHYGERAGTYMLVGDALGRAMVELEGNVSPPGDGYAGWIAGPFSGSLTDPDPVLDFDGGSLPTGIEWVLGGDPTSGADDATLAPTLDTTSDPDGKVLFVFRRSAAAANAAITVEYGDNLGGWTPAAHQGTAASQITITELTDGFAPGIDMVTVALPANLAASDKLFARLKVGVSTR